jgi:hypothetical protein
MGMKRLILALTLFGTALGANAALYLRAEKDAESPVGASEILLAGRKLTVPRALIRDRAQMAGGRLDRLDLVMTIEDFAPIPQPSPRGPERPMPERLTMILTPSGTGPDSATLFQTIYARFLSGATIQDPAGLTMRRFRPGSPYEDRELFIGAGGRQPFIALCPRDPDAREIEPCTTLLRKDGLDIELRLKARHLAEWRRITAAALELVAQLASPRTEAAKAP